MVSIFEKLKNTAKDLIDEKTWGIKADNAILTPAQLEQVHPKIVQDPNRQCWNDKNVTKNSEYNAKTNTIHVRPSYDIEKDITRNIIHEKCHAYLTQIAKLSQSSFFHRDYPENTLEQVAYTTQFYYLIKDGYILDEIKKISLEYVNLFAEHDEVLTKYWNYAQKKYDEEQLTNVVMRFKKSERL